MTEITFILPTMNRKETICRAIDSCLACLSPTVRSHVLILDGRSSDGSYELLIEKYGSNPRVRIEQIDRIGFQRTAYKGVSMVETELVSYMYDDDVLTPYFFQLIEGMNKTGHRFVMGYGKMHPVDSVVPFTPIKSIREFSKENALLAYFGHPFSLPSLDMPVSPICCVVETSFLKEWVAFSQQFARQSEFRQFFMIEQNIGPDEIIFLANILREQKSVLIASQVVGQFSSHPESMSIGYGFHHLATGYWIGKVWAFEKLMELKDKALATKCAANLVIESLRLVAEMIWHRKSKWMRPLYLEVGSIIGTIYRQRCVLRFMVYLGIFGVFRIIKIFYKRPALVNPSV